MVIRTTSINKKVSIEKKKIPCKDEVPGCHGRFSLRGNNDGYIGNVVNGSISHRDTRGCLSPAVDSSQPTYPQQDKDQVISNLLKYLMKSKPETFKMLLTWISLSLSGQSQRTVVL